MFIRVDFELYFWIYILLLTGSLPPVSCQRRCFKDPLQKPKFEDDQVPYRKGSQSCLTLCNSMDCSPPGSSVHGIFQAWMLELVAISSSRESSWPRDQTCISCIAGGFFTTDATREAHITLDHPLKYFKSSLDYL